MPPDVGLCAQLACVWEATARKPGNVHRFCDFSDVTYLDFVLSAAAIAPVLAGAGRRRVGETVLECVRATRQVSATNTNLGIILLLAPLAAVPAGAELPADVARVLADLDVADSRCVFEAIRLASPGGLGRAPDQDVADVPTLALQAIMGLAADRDAIARQYATGFRQVFEVVCPALLEGLQRTGALESAVIRSQLELLARYPDTLIARKCGTAVAAEASERAARVLNAGWPGDARGRDELRAFDDWLRQSGHRRNPGATADLLTAGLFVLLRDGRLTLPVGFPWQLASFGVTDLADVNPQHSQ